MAQNASAIKPISEEEATAYLAAIVDSSDDAILSKTLDGIVTSWNRGAEKLYGYSAQEAVGQPISFLVPAERREELQQVTERIKQGERVERLETVRVAKDGRQVWVSLTLSPILGADGGIVGVSSIARDVTERLRLDRLLRESEKRYRTIVEMAQDAVVVHQDNGRFVYANCAGLGIFGAVALEQLQQRNLLDLIHPDEREKARVRMQQLLDGEELPLREYRLLRLDGREVDVEASSTLIDYHGGPSIQIIARNITERKRAERDREKMLNELAFQQQALADSEERLKLALDAAEMGSCDMEVATGKGVWSRRHFLLLGYEPPENGGAQASTDMWTSLIHPDDLEQVTRELGQAKRQGSLFRSEHRIVRADNRQIVWVNVQGRFICDPAGAACRFIGVIFDVTERKASEETLRRSELRFRLMADSMPQIAWTAEPDGSIDYINLHFELYTGIEREDRKILDNLIHPEQLIYDLVHPEDAERAAKTWRHAIATAEIFQSETRIRRVDGAYRWHLSRAIPERDADGRVIKWYGTATDVNDLRETQEALKKSESTLKLAIETTGLGIFDLDLATGKGFWSDIAKRHYGLPPEAEADLASLMLGVHPEDRERLEQIAREAAEQEDGRIYRAEYRTIGKQVGQLRWLTMRGRVLPSEQGAPHLVGACLDISEIVKAENALKEEISERLRAVEELGRQEQLLIKQGRLAAMGEMIGNIAHQWRQPLNTLGLIVQELPRYYERNLLSKEYLDASVTRAMQVINYMSKTIDGFRNFFGPDKEKQPFRASEVLAKTISIVEAAFNELQLKIEVSADEEIVVVGCPNEYSQVILNILMNAKDAILERKIAEPKVVLRLFRENDRSVLTIADNAGGIAPEIMDRIFDPYFTTKGPDKGTGIGLFMSKTIIEKNMNGALSARNTEEGAEFRIEA